MIQNNNIELNIRQKNGVGITYGIDAKLDELFKQDIKLNASAWNSIMEIVKNDNATTEKQYSGGDTDINNGKHFIVTQNTYQITKKAWDDIVAKVSNLLNLTPPSEEGEQAQITEEPETPENAVKSLIGETAFNNLNDNFKTEVLKKYSTITDYAQNNNIEISDAEMARRLNNYITALKAHEQELKFGEHLISNGADADFTGESIIYDDIATEKAKPPSEENDNAYYATLLNRGIGTVQLYDTNGDNKVSRDEFLAKEKADWKKLTGEDITSDMEDATTSLFNRINKDNDTEFLSNAELGAFEYARATTGDVSTNSNQELTYEEWYLSSSGIGVSDKITSDFERAQNQIYQILENRDKPI